MKHMLVYMTNEVFESSFRILQSIAHYYVLHTTTCMLESKKKIENGYNIRNLYSYLSTFNLSSLIEHHF